MQNSNISWNRRNGVLAGTNGEGWDGMWGGASFVLDFPEGMPSAWFLSSMSEQCGDPAMAGERNKKIR